MGSRNISQQALRGSGFACLEWAVARAPPSSEQGHEGGTTILSASWLILLSLTMLGSRGRPRLSHFCS